MGYRDMLLYGTQYEGNSMRGQLGVEVEPYEMLEMVRAIDTLEAELLLAQCVLCKPYDGQVGEVLEFARRLIRCDVLDEQVGDEKLCGLTAEELRTRSHRPQEFYGQPHFMPAAGDGEGILRVNRARCAARAAELSAVAAFSDREGNPTRPDILKALNRLSSMLYIIMIQLKAGK